MNSSASCPCSCELYSTPPVVLLIEDDEDIRQIMELWIETNYNCRVISAGRAEGVVELAQRYNPVLIMMDLVLPGVSGYEATALLQSEATTSHIPILAVSSQCWDLDIKEKIVGYGSYGCIDKGYLFERLFDYLDPYLQRHVN